MRRLCGKAVHFVALWALVLAGGTVAAQDYPTRPIRLIVPFAPGGATDIIARIVAPKLAEMLAQSVVVENRAGGGTLIGTRATLLAPPDGYTLLMNSPSMATNSLAYRKPGYAMSDFIAVHPLTVSRFVLSAHSAVPARNLAELVSYGKANPGKLTSASLGGSNITHLSMERFKVAAGFNTLTVTYGGSGPANQALMAGVVDLFVDGGATAFQAAKSGKTRMLAITGAERARFAPDIPTFAELGYPTMSSAQSWFALFASASTPEPVVQRLRRDLGKVLAIADIRERITGLGFEIWSGSPQDFQAYVTQTLGLWEQDIRRAKLELDE